MKVPLLRRNIRLFYGGAVLRGLVGIFAPTLVLFQTQTLGLSLAQVMLGEGLFALFIMLFEIPSGIWADKISRKKTLIFGNFIAFIGVLLFALSQNFFHIVLSQAIIGIALAARSGADQAMIYDSLLATGEENQYQKILSRLKSIEFGTAILGTALGGLVAANFGLRLPSILAAIAWGSVGLLYLLLEEPARQKLSGKTSFLEYGRKGFQLIRQSSFLLWLIVFAMVINTGLKLNFQTLNPMWEIYEVPVIWFGIALAAYNALAMITSLLIPQFLQRFGSLKALALVWIIIVFGFGGMAVLYLGAWGAVLFPIIFQIGRSILPIVTNDLIQKTTESSTRATVISMKSFVKSLSQFFYLWFFGILADASGLFAGFALTTVLAFVIGGMALWQIRRIYTGASDKVLKQIVL